ncbi:hypothetical protein H0W91_00565 [Patescibacteria group bacterium]|nr:hypothetical protein [Patescibacteria group bacterium]
MKYNFMTMIFSKITKNIFLFLSLFLFLPISLNAQSVSFGTSKSTYEVGSSILVSVVINTQGQSINTIGGQVSFPTDKVTITDVRYGNSIISLWVDKPAVNSSSGTIKFTGGIPGGYSGSNGSVFTFVARPNTVGSVTFNLNDVHVLANDGSGAEVPGVKTPSLSLTITTATIVPSKTTTTTVTPAPVKTVEPVQPPDVIAPESFVPLIGHHPSVADDAFFVSFFAVDKDSGVTQYKIQESPTIISIFGSYFDTPWEEATSPYVLKYQRWGSTVSVKAIDQAGNFAISKVSKPFSNNMILVLMAVLSVIVFLVTRFFTIRKMRHHLRKKV